MTPEIQRLFEEVCELPAALRAQYLESHTDNPDVRREVLSLLGHDALAEQFLVGSIESAAVSMLSEAEIGPGGRIGAFTVVRLLGRGGMGAVYLATRTDGAFEQTVAIKVIQSNQPAAFLLSRFQQERQILATLNHPNIARLFDGGETSNGLAYLVMEYVEGREIDSYCSERALDLKSQLSLFLLVASAVQYAHENLVVHRDLKPSNILVSKDGAPKLLDFGIAKVLDPLSQSAVATSARGLTPEYASPEQVRGDPITTATDVYSLGAVLYRLLAGRPPHSVQELSPLNAAIRISEQEAPRASNVPADVAAILQKALHPDPARRYRSADELSNDIQRYLDAKPVLAAADSWSYRTAKFLRRNWIPVSASLTIALALVVGAGVAIWQGQKAERRFAEVRQLSNKFLFEFEGSIHNVPGTTKARELVIKTAQEYLDRLASEAGRDPQLIHELAEAYHKLGDVQGSPVKGNKGDARGALASYRREVALRDSVDDMHASASQVRTEYLQSLVALAGLETTAGDADRAVPLCQRAVSVAESWLPGGSADPALLTAASNSYAQLSNHQGRRGDFEASVASAQHALSLQQRATELGPPSDALLRALAVRHWAVGSAEKIAGHSEQAIEQFRTTVELLRQVSSRDAANAQNRRELLGASWLLADSMVDLLRKQKKGEQSALPLWEDALRLGNELLKADPGNALVEADVALISLGLAGTLQDVGRPQAGIDILLPVIERQEHRHAAVPDNRTAAHYLALLRMQLAECQKDLRNLNAALASRRAAMQIFDTLVSTSPSNYQYRHDKASNLQGAGDLLATLGDYPGAHAMYRQGLEIAEGLTKVPSLSDAASLVTDLRAADGRLPAADSRGESKPPKK